MARVEEEGRFEKPAPDARAIPFEAHESLVNPELTADIRAEAPWT